MELLYDKLMQCAPFSCMHDIQCLYIYNLKQSGDLSNDSTLVEASTLSCHFYVSVCGQTMTAYLARLLTVPQSANLPNSVQLTPGLLPTLRQDQR